MRNRRVDRNSFEFLNKWILFSALVACVVFASTKTRSDRSMRLSHSRVLKNLFFFFCLILPQELFIITFSFCLFLIFHVASGARASFQMICGALTKINLRRFISVEKNFDFLVFEFWAETYYLLSDCCQLACCESIEFHSERSDTTCTDLGCRWHCSVVRFVCAAFGSSFIGRRLISIESIYFKDFFFFFSFSLIFAHFPRRSFTFN